MLKERRILRINRFRPERKGKTKYFLYQQLDRYYYSADTSFSLYSNGTFTFQFNGDLA